MKEPSLSPIRASAFLPTVLLMSLFQRKPAIGLTTMTTRFISRPSAIIWLLRMPWKWNWTERGRIPNTVYSCRFQCVRKSCREIKPASLLTWAAVSSKELALRPQRPLSLALAIRRWRFWRKSRTSCLASRGLPRKNSRLSSNPTGKRKPWVISWYTWRLSVFRWKRLRWSEKSSEITAWESWRRIHSNSVRSKALASWQSIPLPVKQKLA